MFFFRSISPDVPGSGESGSGDLGYVEWEGVESSDLFFKLSSTILEFNPTSVDSPPVISTTFDGIFIQPTPTTFITATESYSSINFDSTSKSSIISTSFFTSSPFPTLLSTKKSNSMSVSMTISTTLQLHTLTSSTGIITQTNALATSTFDETVQTTSQQNTLVPLPTNEPGLVTGILIWFQFCVVHVHVSYSLNDLIH